MDTKKALKKAIKIIKLDAKVQADWIEWCESIRQTPDDKEFARYDELMQIKEVLEGLKQVAIGIDRGERPDFWVYGVGPVNVYGEYGLKDETTTP